MIKKFKGLFIGFLVVFAVLSGVCMGETEGDGDERSPSEIRKDARERLMGRLLEKYPEADADEDGMLSMEEFKAFREKKMRENFEMLLKEHPEMDINGDGKLTRKEFAAFRGRKAKKGPEEAKKQVPLAVKKPGKPNFIFIYADDLGYGDLGCYGSEKNKTPNIDRLAEEGMRFTDFYVTSGVCTPSRSSLMTGCYPRRVDMHVDSRGLWVLFPNAKKGLNPEEITVAEVLKKEGYATGCVGKWHLGDQKQFLPTSQGFDYYYGIPYSNDMNRKKIPLPLLRNEEVIEAPVHQPSVTTDYTREAVKFIEENKDKPFFFYLPHTMVHVPLQASEKFKDKTSNGRYGDALAEVDWSTGQIMKKLKDLGIDDKTMVIFSSDNGTYRGRGGSNDPLRGFKGNTDEGSMRVPFVVRYPGKVPEGKVCGELASTLDILPTFAKLSGGGLPVDRVIDGKNIWPLMSGQEGAKSPYEAFYYYHTTQLQAVRSGNWKLILPLEVKKRGWSGSREDVPLKLVNLEEDIHEDHDVSRKHPEVVKRLKALADKARADLGDMDKEGAGQREAGWVEEPTPLLMDK